MSFQNILRKRENPERGNMNFPNRPTEQNLQTRPRMMTPHEEKNAPKIKSGTPGIVLIGSGIKVRGTFEACDIAEIHGSLDGEIQTRELIIHEGGQLAGMAICKIARISGKLDGEIEAAELLQIENTGRVDGRVSYARLVIEDGGLIKGDVSPSTEPVLQKAAIPANETPDVTSVKNNNQGLITGDFAAE
jgi:cytoskeletal protein CcmA (bactofilin family)